MTIWQYHIRWLKLIFAGLIVCKKGWKWVVGKKSVELHPHLTEEHHSAFLVKARQWKVSSPTQHLLVVVVFVIWQYLYHNVIWNVIAKSQMRKKQILLKQKANWYFLTWASGKFGSQLSNHSGHSPFTAWKLSSFSCKSWIESCLVSPAKVKAIQLFLKKSESYPAFPAKVKIVQFLLQRWKLSSFSCKSESCPASPSKVKVIQFQIVSALSSTLVRSMLNLHPRRKVFRTWKIKCGDKLFPISGKETDHIILLNWVEVRRFCHPRPQVFHWSLKRRRC